MLKPFLKIFKGKSEKKRARFPKGQRAYVIGDIHGRRDLFDALIHAIEEDDKESGEADTVIILLGDLVDRGPDSAGVIKLARLWEEYRNVRYLFGNHEEMFLDAFTDLDIMRHFLKHGGRETILSYGVKSKEFNNATAKELQAMMAEMVPEEDKKFLKGFEDMIIMGDYLFVHAGINPKRALDEQKPRELRWIRDPFLQHKDRHTHIVVHGHTITRKIDERKNRIGVDTGAYKSGTLTALVLEDDTRRYIQTAVTKKGKIKIVKTAPNDEG
ncbi:metallophosphoesterase family protein [Pontixanthobacter aquaemixtae]|uniref:Serine/threonine protein phosphatase n=1 Tax=Pontixanthobacter aquaemixtae TaxID=1958940 RepID=A0A844ZM16_9SPHN|nr:metallophosphoesterase family protein [Pontixanthobacter aquaemixtae]MXO89441.1 serine/threonine protein phosphatase [Pontixanthobacter aquaemixtae]